MKLAPLGNRGSSRRTLRRLFFDIETSPNVVLSWRTGYKISIDSENILKERAVICIGYKWEGDRSAKVLTWDQKQDDKALLKTFVKVADEADEIVAHNGDKFDMPWFLTRCAYHGIRTFPHYKTADTLQWARRKFYFNSNRLNYIGQYLGLGKKLKTEFGLWKAVCLDNDRKALDRMAKYCARDVGLLQGVWERLSELVPHKTHAGVLAGRDKWSCPQCSSEHVIKHQRRVTAAGSVQHNMQCLDCGRFYRISGPTADQYTEAKAKA